MMQRIKNIILPGTGNLPMGLDIFFEETGQPKPVVIYVHGFNGFKDWANFDLIAATFAAAGYVLVKFNFSHNGTTPSQPEEFGNLEAFGNNNYSSELEDPGLVINWVCSKNNPYRADIDNSQLCLAGHSMEGGIAVLKTAEDKRISKLITWASVSECKTPWGNWPQSKMEEWKQTSVQFYLNGRTQQQMPMYYQLYEDFINNHDRLDIEKAIKTIHIPILICHGTQDSSVSIESAFRLKEWQPAAKLFTVNSDHVFGRKHPWPEATLPSAMQEVINASLDFLGGRL